MDKQCDIIECAVRWVKKVEGSLLAASLLVTAAAAESSNCADLALVLAIDGSGSIDTEEYITQLEGYRSALSSDEVQRALRQAGKVDLGAVLWGDDSSTSTVFPLRSVNDPPAVEAFAEELRWAGRRTWGNTGIGAAVSLSLDVLDAPGRCASRRVINVSGDGRSWHDPHGVRSESYVAPEVARDRAAVNDVTINGLAILNEDAGLADYYRDVLIVGPGAFVMEVEGFKTFRDALLRKLVREIQPAVISELSN